MPLDLNAVQQSFARRYMTCEQIVGVRVSRDSDGFYLDVLVPAEHADNVTLPVRHEGLRVIGRAGERAILAFAGGR